MRQLYYYRFQRITKGEDADCYHHKLFVRQEKSWAQRIIRSNRKDKKSTSHADTKIYQELSGRNYKYDIHNGETSYYENATPISDPNTMLVSGSVSNDNGLLDNKDSETTQELAHNPCSVNTLDQNLIVPLDSGSYKMSKMPTNTLSDDIKEAKKEKDTEVDLYSPNLEQTSIFMDNFGDDVQFSLVLQSLCLIF